MNIKNRKGFFGVKGYNRNEIDNQIKNYNNLKFNESARGVASTVVIIFLFYEFFSGITFDVISLLIIAIEIGFIFWIYKKPLSGVITFITFRLIIFLLIVLQVTNLNMLIGFLMTSVPILAIAFYYLYPAYQVEKERKKIKNIPTE